MNWADSVSRLVIAAMFVVAVAGVSDLLVGRRLLSDPLVVVGVVIGFMIAAVGPSVRTVVRRRN